MMGAIGAGEQICSMPADNIYLWVCGKCDRIPAPDHMARMLRLVEWLKETPKGYPILEWGVYTGASGMMLSIFGDGDPYKGVDWFLGLAPTEEDGETDKDFSMTGEQIRRVRERLPGVTKASAVLAADVLPDSPIRFAHVDVDLYAPTKIALFRSWDLLVPGGKMVTDDYNWTGARKAADAFSEASGVKPTIFGTQAVWTKC